MPQETIGKISYGIRRKFELLRYMSIYYKRFFESDIIYVNDRLFELSTIDSFNKISKKTKKTNFLVWAALRHSIPPHLK